MQPHPRQARRLRSHLRVNRAWAELGGTRLRRPGRLRPRRDPQEGFTDPTPRQHAKDEGLGGRSPPRLTRGVRSQLRVNRTWAELGGIRPRRRRRFRPRRDPQEGFTNPTPRQRAKDGVSGGAQPHLADKAPSITAQSESNLGRARRNPASASKTILPTPRSPRRIHGPHATSARQRWGVWGGAAPPIKES
jgi:hypothetical protein